MLYITSLNRLKRYKATMLNRSISNIFTILITKRMPQKQIISLFNDQENIKEIGKYNYHYAKTHFYASNVALKMESIFNKEYKNGLK